MTGTEGGLDMSTLAGLCKDPKAIRKAADVNIPLAKPPVPVPVAKQELTLQHRAAKGAPTLAATVEVFPLLNSACLLFCFMVILSVEI